MISHLLSDSGARQQHLDCEGDDGGQSADDGQIEEPKEDRCHGLFAQRTDKHCKDRAASRCPTYGAKDDGYIQRY